MTISRNAVMCPHCGVGGRVRFGIVWNVLWKIAIISLFYAIIGAILSGIFHGPR
jgi:hypothetical protein